MTKGIPDLPQYSGRRVVETRQLSSTKQLRLEWVPCGSQRCKKNVDEHGPYWYRYEWDGTAWRSYYLGTSEPHSFTNLAIAEAKVLKWLRKAELSDVEAAEAGEMVAGLNNYDGGEESRAQELADKIGSALTQRRIRIQERHEALGRGRHSELFAKVRRGEGLTETELSEFERLASIIAMDH